MKLASLIKRIDYRHYICAGITAGFLACTVCLFPGAFGRLIEGVRDFGLSVAFYFCKLFGAEDAVRPTVNELPRVPFFSFGGGDAPSTVMPDNFAAFKEGWSAYWAHFASKEAAAGYLKFLGEAIYSLCYALLFVMPLFALLKVMFKRYMKRENNDYDKDSVHLARLRILSAKTYHPAKRWLKAFNAFMDASVYPRVWLVIWLFNFNVFTILAEAVAYYLYFTVTFDVVSIYRQVYKLCLDLAAPFGFIPWWAWVMLGLYLFDRIRKGIAAARLMHMEMKNRGFVNARCIVTMVTATMGKKKTTAITDMALSQEVMFRDKALEMILENDMRFPHFPWITLENELKRAIEHHEVFNLATCRLFAQKKAVRWHKNKTRARLFGYDYARHGLTYCDELKVYEIWDVLEIYAQLYFIYIIQSSLLVANYSVRVDSLFADLGNFPLWNTDFFARDARLIDSFSRHAHILDFNVLRLGRKVLADNLYQKDAFEFGTVVITEIGKERGNSLELQGVSKKSDEANQKNDLLNHYIKLCRHPATVDNFPFVKIFTDEQRPESWGADARDLAEIVHIRDSGERRLAMPWFSLEELLYAWVFRGFVKLYREYRHRRGDNTLFLHFVKTVVAKFHSYYVRTYSKYSYCALGVEVERGTMDGAVEDTKYFLMAKKIYSKRFATDCYSEFFAEKTMQSPVGLDDLPEYATEKATYGEMDAQNSYFFNELKNIGRKEHEREKE